MRVHGLRHLLLPFLITFSKRFRHEKSLIARLSRVVEIWLPKVPCQRSGEPSERSSRGDYFREKACVRQHVSEGEGESKAQFLSGSGMTSYMRSPTVKVFGLCIETFGSVYAGNGTAIRVSGSCIHVAIYTQGSAKHRLV